MRRTVYVYRYRYQNAKNQCRGFTLAYLRQQCSDPCIHEVEAASGYKARMLARTEHRLKCGNRFTTV